MQQNDFLFVLVSKNIIVFCEIQLRVCLEEVFASPGMLLNLLIEDGITIAGLANKDLAKFAFDFFAG